MCAVSVYVCVPFWQSAFVDLVEGTCVLVIWVYRLAGPLALAAKGGFVPPLLVERRLLVVVRVSDIKTAVQYQQ